ncbi:MAG: hypothetical protein ACREE4_09310 [Stellaceae bacterium]
MDLWTIGFADRLRFPRFAAQSGEMLGFAHNFTGPGNNQDLCNRLGKRLKPNHLDLPRPAGNFHPAHSGSLPGLFCLETI